MSGGGYCSCLQEVDQPLFNGNPNFIAVPTGEDTKFTAAGCYIQRCMYGVLMPLRRQ
jgi:hypothetical protein